MPSAVTLASRRAAPPVPRVHTPAHPTTPAPAVTAPPKAPHTAPDLIQLHAQACNALHMALRHLTGPDCTPAMWERATARALRGLSALKQAGALANQGGAA